MKVKPMDFVLGGWKVYINAMGETVAVSAPGKPAEVPRSATCVLLSPADFKEALKRAAQKDDPK